MKFGHGKRFQPAFRHSSSDNYSKIDKNTYCNISRRLVESTSIELAIIFSSNE